MQKGRKARNSWWRKESWRSLCLCDICLQGRESLDQRVPKSNSSSGAGAYVLLTVVWDEVLQVGKIGWLWIAKIMPVWAIFKMIGCGKAWIWHWKAFELTGLSLQEEINNLGANTQRPSLSYLYNSSQHILKENLLDPVYLAFSKWVIHFYTSVLVPKMFLWDLPFRKEKKG